MFNQTNSKYNSWKYTTFRAKKSLNLMNQKHKGEVHTTIIYNVSTATSIECRIILERK